MEFRDISKSDPLDVLLDSMGLYQTSWTGYDKVIKLKSNEYTIFTKRDGIWTWYNEPHFKLIESDNKSKLLDILKPKYGSEV